MSTIFAMAIFLGTPVAANADSTSSDDLLLSDYNNWNIVTFGDAKLHAESEGAVAVGGTLSFTGTNTALHTSAEDNISVLAQNIDLSESTGTLQAMNGTVRIGNTEKLDVLNKDNNGASVNVRVVKQGAGYDSNPNINASQERNASNVAAPKLFSETFNQKKAVSLAQTTAAAVDKDTEGVDAQVSIDYGTAVVKLTSGKRNYWEVSSETLVGLHEIKFEGTTPNADTNTFLIVSVSGENVTFKTTLCGARDPKAILWVAPDATTVEQRGDSLDGSLLAPRANLEKTSANIQGTIIVQSGTFAGSEQHYYPYRGAEPNIPEEPTKPETPAEPEEPTDPEEPTYPAKPTLPNFPEDPTEPEEPETPTEPEEPETPVIPKEPTEPITPEEPHTPETPTDPEKPVTPEEPKTPETPTPPTEPKEPTDPEEPQEPKEPTDPKDPKEPTTPQTPTDPKEPTDPQDPTQPEEPTEPRTPTVPTNPVVPTSSEKSPQDHSAAPVSLAQTGADVSSIAALVMLVALGGIGLLSIRKRHSR